MRLSYMFIHNKTLYFQNARADSSTKFHQVHSTEISSPPSYTLVVSHETNVFVTKAVVSSLKVYMACWVGC